MNKQLLEVARFYSEIESTDVKWLWYPYIPYGKLTLVQGDPGEGKTSLVLKLAAILSHGGVMPDGIMEASPQKIIYQAAEDSPSDTIKPRLLHYGADCENIAFIEETGDYHMRLEENDLLDAIDGIGARLLVFDPIQAFINRESDGTGIRQKMTILSQVAEKSGCAIIMIGHMNKKENGKELYRGLGSIDIVAAARSVITISRAEEKSSARIIRHTKSSLTHSGSDFGFEISEDGDIEWIGVIENEADEVAEQARQRLGIKAEKAKELLYQWLRNEDMTFTEIMKRFEKIGISQRTVSSAKKEIGVRSVKTADGWLWHLEYNELGENE